MLTHNIYTEHQNRRLPTPCTNMLNEDYQIEQRIKTKIE